MTSCATGIVRSYYWAYVAKSIAKEENELCEHARYKTLIVNIGYQENEEMKNVKMKVFCPLCFGELKKTEKAIEKKFLEFYGK